MNIEKDSRKMSDHQIDTIIVAAFVAKQKVTISLFNGEERSGFICSDFDQDGFSLTSCYIWWKDIRFVQPEDKFYKDWTDILEKASDPFVAKEADM